MHVNVKKLLNMLWKTFKILSIIGIELVLIGIISFYIIIVKGYSKNLQEIWVNTAMTTFTHEWLATSFIDNEIINEIVERNKVHDEEYATDAKNMSFSLQVGFGAINEKWFKGDAIQELKEIGDRNIIDTEGTYEELQREKDIRKYKLLGYDRLEDGIYFKEKDGEGYKGYLLLIQDPSRITLTQTSRQFECGETVKDMVNREGAIIGINGGGFDDGPNYDSNGGIPAGLLIVNNEVINYGNGEHSVVGFNSDNVFVVGRMTKDEAVENKIRDCVDFKPCLIANGETIIKEGTGGWGIAPRTALGQKATGEVIFFCVDGRQLHSIGVDLRVLQDVLYEEGCVNAAMVDGGSSTVMYHKELGYLNKPSLGHERWINNCWIIK